MYAGFINPFAVLSPLMDTLLKDWTDIDAPETAFTGMVNARAIAIPPKRRPPWKK